MASRVGHWQLHGFGPYAAVEKDSGQLIGAVGFWFPNDWPEPQIKWALAPAFWGKGFVSEGARTLRRVAHEAWPNQPLISLISAENTASSQLAEAVGATLEKHLEFRGSQWSIYRHPAVAASG